MMFGFVVREHNNIIRVIGYDSLEFSITQIKFDWVNEKITITETVRINFTTMASIEWLLTFLVVASIGILDFLKYLKKPFEKISSTAMIWKIWSFCRTANWNKSKQVKTSWLTEHDFQEFFICLLDELAPHTIS